MIELKVKVEEQLIHQFGKVEIEQYLWLKPFAQSNFTNTNQIL